jgi:hypothetical protein
METLQKGLIAKMNRPGLTGVLSLTGSTRTCRLRRGSQMSWFRISARTMPSTASEMVSSCAMTMNGTQLRRRDRAHSAVLMAGPSSTMCSSGSEAGWAATRGRTCT